MLYELVTKDIKLTGLAQTGCDNYLNNSYKAAFDALTEKRYNDESIRGFSLDNVNEVYHFAAYMLGLLIYIESERGVNTSYEYFDEKYDFDTIRKKLDCYNIELAQVFQAFALFSDRVIYPKDVIDNIYYPNIAETGSVVTYEGIHNLVAGINVITHGKNGDVREAVVRLSDGFSQTFAWSGDNTAITDARNQVVIHSPMPYSNCIISVIVDIS